MKTILNERVASSLLLILFLTIGSSLAIAGVKDCEDPKWENHPLCTGTDTEPDPDDLCANFSAPDYAFWRDSHTREMAQVTIYAAESDTGCEAKLVDVPLPEGPINKLELAYSSDESNGQLMGRVVWANHRFGESQSVWMFDFKIDEGQIIPEANMPLRIMNYEIVGVGWNIEHLDLSPDMQSLVYLINDYREDEPDYLRIFTLEIGGCLTSSCPFSSGQELYVLEEWPDTYEAVHSPVWGPLGERIYFVERVDGTYFIKFFDFDSTEPQPETFFRYDGEERIFDVSSGISSSGEMLAVEIGTDIFIHGCRSIYTLDVASCEETQSCDLNREFAGIWPSWNKDGELIHTYQGTRLKKVCKTDTVGIWDGTNLKALLKGYEPEAAGG